MRRFLADSVTSPGDSWTASRWRANMRRWGEWPGGQMGVCWTDDRDPFGSPAPAPGRAAGPAPVPGSAAGAGPGPAQHSGPPARV